MIIGNVILANTRNALEITACLEHISTLSFKSSRLYYETYIKLFLNIDTLHLLLYFTLYFLSIFVLPGFLH